MHGGRRRALYLRKRLNFKEYFVSIGNEDHAVWEIGDHEATSDKILLLIGGAKRDQIGKLLMNQTLRGSA